MYHYNSFQQQCLVGGCLLADILEGQVPQDRDQCPPASAPISQSVPSSFVSTVILLMQGPLPGQGVPHSAFAMSLSHLLFRAVETSISPGFATKTDVHSILKALTPFSKQLPLCAASVNGKGTFVWSDEHTSSSMFHPLISKVPACSHIWSENLIRFLDVSLTYSFYMP